VNEKYEVLDGQHRLEAAKSLGLDIYYFLKNNGSYKDIIDFNQHKKNWKSEDYLKLFAEGTLNNNYLKLQNFMKINNFDLAQALIILNGPIKQMREYSDFKSGAFIYPSDEAYIENLVEKVKYFWNMISSHNIKPLHRFKNTAFLKPYLIFITNPLVNWELFQQKLELSWFKIGTRPSNNLYLEMFMDIYNFRNQNKITIS